MIVIPTATVFMAMLSVTALAAEELSGIQRADASVDHSAFDALLSAYVRQGRVDYAGLKNKAQDLEAYLDTLADVEIGGLRRDERLALYINAYNAATLMLILEHYPGIKSIRDIPEAKRWQDPRWVIAGRQLSLDDIEHQVLRKRFGEPRIHFAIVCASIGCPPLRAEAFVADKIEKQLDDQARQFNRNQQYVRWAADTNTLYISTIYDWFAEDFEKAGGNVLQFIVHYAEPDVARQVQSLHSKPNIQYLDYDWSLNDIKAD